MKAITWSLLATISLLIIGGIFYYCNKPQPKTISPTDSLKHEIENIEDSILILNTNYEKSCSIIFNQSFAADTLFFSDYLERYNLHHNSRTVKAN